MDVARWSACKGMAGLVVAALLGLLLLPGPMHAAGFVCAAGDVACLIAAIHAANANGEENTITLAAGAYTLTAVDNDTDGPNGLPSMMGRLTITGVGADTTIIERAAGAMPFRLLHVAATGVLTLEGLTLRGGNDATTNGGGGIYNRGTLTLTDSTLSDNTTRQGGGGGISHIGSTLTITGSTLSGNVASQGGGIGTSSLTSLITITNSTLSENVASGSGGGINAFSPLTITNSTVNGNTASGSGGGISQGPLNTLTLTNSTLSGNTASQGGGISISGGGTLIPPGHAILGNTILAHNTVPSTGTGPDCVTTFGPSGRGRATSQSHNLIGNPTGCTITLLETDLTGDPKLGDFTDDSTPGGGYFPLLPDSPAIDAGNDEVCPETDQLGQPRVGQCDIGAIEFQPPDVDVVAIRHAIFVDQLALLFVVATSSAAPDVELFVTVPECLTQVPMPRIADRYILVRAVPKCGDLDAHTATVASSRGGVASAPLR
jgi:hypothetical protein